jgi:hypothetical protein
LASLNELDIRFYKEAKIIGEAMLQKYKANITDPKCLGTTYFLPKQIEHMRGKIDTMLKAGFKEKMKTRGSHMQDFGNSTATTELLCIARVPRTTQNTKDTK